MSLSLMGWRQATLRLIAFVAIATLLVGLTPATVAQDEPVATAEPVATEEPPAATRLNPNDDGPGGSRLNPMVRREPEPDPTPIALPTRRSTATDDSAEVEAATSEEPAADAAAEGTEAEQASGRSDDAADGQATARPAEQSQDANAQPVAAPQTAQGDPAPNAAGGDADSVGEGGTIIQSALISGNNRGTEVNVEDCAYGSVQIDGGTVVNATDISLSANGGTAVSTANGGDDGVVRAGGAVASRRISAGNGGSADAGANGGSIVTGAMITGNNRGHEVNFADCPGGRGDAVLIIDTGDISNTTSIDISANGGTALADASGGSGNLVTGGLRGAAGNGGSAETAANGGTVITGAMITGNNRGNSITVGRPAEGDGTTGAGSMGPCAGGPVTVIIDGGNISNSTAIDISADGGVAVSDASGGDRNTGIGGGFGGNGGAAEASANGGAIIMNAMITGNNRGNAISVGNVAGCGSAPANVAAPAPAAVPRPSMASGPAAASGLAATPRQAMAAGGKPGVVVRALPNTGTGQPVGTVRSRSLVFAIVGLLGGSLVLAGSRAGTARTRLRQERTPG